MDCYAEMEKTNMRLYDERRVYIVLCAAVVLNCILLLSHTESMESVLFRYAVRGFSLGPVFLAAAFPPVWVYVKKKLKTSRGFQILLTCWALLLLLHMALR